MKGVTLSLLPHLSNETRSAFLITEDDKMHKQEGLLKQNKTNCCSEKVNAVKHFNWL